MGEGEVEKTLLQLSPFFASIFPLFPRNASLRSADAFPVVAFLPQRSDDRKCVCASQASANACSIVSAIFFRVET